MTPPPPGAGLKGVCHEIFELHFFHDLSPSRPLINRLKYFRIQFDFAEIFDHKARKFDSVVCMTTWSQNFRLSKSKKFSSVLTPQCASHRVEGLQGVHHTTESDYFENVHFLSFRIYDIFNYV